MRTSLRPFADKLAKRPNEARMFLSCLDMGLEPPNEPWKGLATQLRDNDEIDDFVRGLRVRSGIPLPDKDFERRKQTHLRRLAELDNNKAEAVSRCLHDHCEECFGTGRRADGSACVHFIWCSCPKCSPARY